MAEDEDKQPSSFKLGDRPADAGRSARGARGTAEASASSGDKKTVEQWAEQKGMLEQNVQLPRSARMGQYIVPASRPNPNHIFFRQAKALRGWPVGQEVTEKEFDSAVIEAQQGISLR